MGDVPPERYHTLTLPQIDRVRWILFPQVRIPEQASLFDEAAMQAEVPDMLRVMDCSKNNWPAAWATATASSTAWRVGQNHGAGLPRRIPGPRPRRRQARAGVFATTNPLAVKLAATMAAKGLSERVHCVHFHKWARAQLVAYGQALPARQPERGRLLADMVQRVITGGPGHIPTGQYLAVLIDEGHDFAPEWLKLVTQMVDYPPPTACWCCTTTRKASTSAAAKELQLQSVGIQAQGRTTILRSTTATRGKSCKPPTPSRATCSPPKTATTTASPRQTRELRPRRPRAHRHPPAHPARTGRQDRRAAAGAHADGFAWGDMAVLCRTRKNPRDLCASTLYKRGVPVQNRLGPGRL